MVMLTRQFDKKTAMRTGWFYAFIGLIMATVLVIAEPDRKIHGIILQIILSMLSNFALGYLLGGYFDIFRVGKKRPKMSMSIKDLATKEKCRCDICNGEEKTEMFHVSIDGVVWHHCRSCVEKIVRIIGNLDVDEDEKKELDKYMKNHPILYLDNESRIDMVEKGSDLFTLFDIF